MSEWINVKIEVPDCSYEDFEHGKYISQVVQVHDYDSYDFNIGFGHMKENGEWVIYKGEHDFMNPEKVTHWKKLPNLPKDI